MTSQGVYFYHIPKTAGMSTWQLLDWAYPANKICPGRMWEDIITLPADTLACYDVFRGHFLAYLEPYLGRTLRTFTLLRDPVERTISHYCHVKRSPDHPFHTDVQGLSLSEFCLHPRTRHMAFNYQTAYLACPGRKNPRAIARELTKDDLSAYRLQLTLDPSPNEFPADEELYRMAEERLHSFTAFGLSETLQESLRRIARALKLPDPPAFGRRNVAENRPAEIDRDTIAAIHKCTELDHALYAVAKRAIEDESNEI